MNVNKMLAVGGHMSIKSYVAFASVSFGFFIAIWAGLSLSGAVPAYFLPSPAAVVQSVWLILTSPSALADIGISFYRVMTGFAISAAIAIPLGVLVGTFKP